MPASGTLSQKQATHFLHEVLWAKGYRVNTLEWSGGPIQGWKTGLIFLVGGTCTGAAMGKALDFYCWRIEQRLIRIEKERVDQETQERERLERERLYKQKLEQEAIEAEIAERKRI